MSNKDGMLNLLLMLGLLFLAAASFFINSYDISRIVILTLLFSGFLLFLISKLSVIRTGQVISFGSGLMNRQYRLLYRFGYALMTIGTVLSLLYIQ